MRRLKLLVRQGAEPLVRSLVALGISANALTLIGFLTTVVAAWIIATGQFQLGGVVFLAVSCVDFLDGAVARLSGSAGPFGAFLDSLLDRASEGVILVGLVYWFAAQQEPLLSALAGVALTGSFLVSYARARAEGLGYDCEVGWLQRPERIVLLGFGLALSPIHPIILPSTLLILAVVTALTTVQRVRHVAAIASERA